MVFQFFQEQQLPIDINSAWAFFSSPENLSEITPEHMGFKILNGQPQSMYNGQIIQYKVKPILNIPIVWVTEIKNVRAPYFFIDEQRKGPYRMWHHQHIFEENEEGVLMKDIITYEPPFGFIGQIANFLFIEKQIRKIFDHRKRYLDYKFSKPDN